ALRVGSTAFWLRLEVPIAPRSEAPGVQAQSQAVTGRQRLDIPEGRPLAVVAIAVHQEAEDDLIVSHRLQAGEGQQRLDLGSEEEIVAGGGIVEGLDAEPVPGTEQAPAPAIPNGK